MILFITNYNYKINIVYMRSNFIEEVTNIIETNYKIYYNINLNKKIILLFY